MGMTLGPHFDYKRDPFEDLYINFFMWEGEFDEYLRFPVRLSIELHVLKKTTNESRLVTFKFDDSTPPEFTARCRRFSHRAVEGGDVLLLKSGEIDSFAVDSCLMFRITKVDTNSTL